MGIDTVQDKGLDNKYTLYFNGPCHTKKGISISADQFYALINIGIIRVFRGVKGNQIIKYNEEDCLRTLQEYGSQWNAGGI